MWREGERRPSQVVWPPSHTIHSHSTGDRGAGLEIQEVEEVEEVVEVVDIHEIQELEDVEGIQEMQEVEEVEIQVVMEEEVEEYMEEEEGNGLHHVMLHMAEEDTPGEGVGSGGVQLLYCRI